MMKNDENLMIFAIFWDFLCFSLINKACAYRYLWKTGKNTTFEHALLIKENTKNDKKSDFFYGFGSFLPD